MYQSCLKLYYTKKYILTKCYFIYNKQRRRKAPKCIQCKLNLGEPVLVTDDQADDTIPYSCWVSLTLICCNLEHSFAECTVQCVSPMQTTPRFRYSISNTFIPAQWRSLLVTLESGIVSSCYYYYYYYWVEWVVSSAVCILSVKNAWEYCVHQSYMSL